MTSKAKTVYGALAHPRVYFRKSTLRDNGGMFDDITEKHLCRYAVLGREVDFYESGYVVVSAVDGEEAEDILNAIFFPIKLLKYSRMDIPYLYQAEIDRLCFNPASQERSHVTTDTWSFRSLYAHCSSLREQMSRKQMDGSMVLDRVPVTDRGLAELCGLANELLKSSDREAILSFIRAYSEREKGSWTGGFFHGFIAIEVFLFSQLRHSLGYKECFNKKGDRIQTADAIVKIGNGLRDGHVKFDANDKTSFDQTFLDRIEALRKKRNKIFHAEIRVNGQSLRATKEEFDECFAVATMGWWRLLKLARIRYSHYIEELQKVEKLAGAWPGPPRMHED